MFDVNGKEYIDLIAGISVCNAGHRHPRVVEAIKKQLDAYLHVMVYGEIVQFPQTAFAKLLTDHLPSPLNCVFFTSSGSEATEGAMKLAKRYTGRTQIIAFEHSYHGSTQGALSVMGDEYWRNAFRPLLPGIRHLRYNSFDDLENITGETACVIAETIQAEAGVIAPGNGWLKALEKKCRQAGALFVLDEIQCGLGRNGTLWAFQQFDVVPDILLLGKALGGGLPLGAFISAKETMDVFTNSPVLGNITTFGGNPVCCASGLAALQVVLEENLLAAIKEKEELFYSLLTHEKIKKIRSRGLMMALEFSNAEENKKVIHRAIQNGVFTDWFLFAPQCLRIVPPLTISHEEIYTACKIITGCLNDSDPE